MSHYAIVYGNHIDVVQRMLDYDYLCGRDPSVKAIMVNDAHPKRQKVFFWAKEIYIPQVNTWDALQDYQPFTMLINFASYRTAVQIVLQALETRLFAWIFTVAEWIAERETREIIAHNRVYGCRLIGPSSVGGIFAGSMRIGNTGGSLENLIASNLHRKWSVGLMTKSWGMMGEMCRVISRHTNGVHTALQVWWDRYSMTTFQDIVQWYQDEPEITVIVLLWEVWNEDENNVADMIRDGRITKPVIAWMAWTSASFFATDVQFGHAWAKANSDRETAHFKNKYFRDAGGHVPATYNEFSSLIGHIYSLSIQTSV